MDSYGPVGTRHEARVLTPREMPRSRKLRRWFWALSQRGSRPVNIAFIGDSVTEGWIATTPNNNWQNVVRIELQRRFGGAGVGYVPAGHNSLAGPSLTGTRDYTRLGSVVDGYQGMGRKRVALAAGGSVQLTETFDRFQVYSGTPGSGTGEIDVYLDSAIVTDTFLTNSAGGQFSKLVYDSAVDGPNGGVIAAGSHTLKLVGAIAAYLEGVYFFNGDFSSGIHTWDWSWGGGLMSTFGSDITWNQGATINGTATPDLVLLSFGFNDQANNLSYATYLADCQNVINKIIALDSNRPPSVLIVQQYARGTDPTGSDGGLTQGQNLENFFKYRDAHYTVANMYDNVEVCDVYNVMGQMTTADPWGFLFNTAVDTVHPKDVGHGTIAQCVLEYLCAAPLSITLSQTIVGGGGGGGGTVANNDKTAAYSENGNDVSSPSNGQTQVNMSLSVDAALSVNSDGTLTVVADGADAYEFEFGGYTYADTSGLPVKLVVRDVTSTAVDVAEAGYIANATGTGNPRWVMGSRNLKPVSGTHKYALFVRADAAGVAHAYGNYKAAAPTFLRVRNVGVPTGASAPTGSHYLNVPASNDGWGRTGDAPGDVVGDIDIRAYINATDWTPTADGAMVAKWQPSNGNRAYWFGIEANTGKLKLQWSDTGTTVNSAVSTVAPTVADGSAIWLRVTLDVNNGSLGRTIVFYYSNDPISTTPSAVSWTQLGTGVTQSLITSILNANCSTAIGAADDAGAAVNPFNSKIHYAEIRDGINGTVKVSPDYRTATAGAFSITDSQGNIWDNVGTATII